MIVDDGEVDARPLAELLGELGYRTTTARDVATGLAAAHAARADVLLLDAGLCRGAAGPELAARLDTADVPVVLIAAPAGADGAAALLASSLAIAGWLTRPVTGAALRVTIEAVRRQRALQAQVRALEGAHHANRAKTDFLAHMSHELRTPLNAVLGLSEALLERIFGALDEPQVRALTTIHASGRHLLALINDVLDIARVESGKLPIEPEQVVLRPLIDESVALVQTQLAGKGQRLVVELAAALPPLDVDRRRIKQVLLNLLGNASKFSPPGATVTLRAAGRDDARRVELAVADDGPGIAAADHARIFEPFVTLDPSMTRAHGGAGLGLTLARRIVELHGGHLHVRSELGRGTTFTVELPMSSAYVGVAPPAPRAASRAAAPDPGGHTILLAEDDEATVLAVRSYLAGNGYHVRAVCDGEAALAAAAARDVAIVVMDVQLPGLDGLEVMRRLRARGSRTSIIALTAHAMPGDEQRCLDAGASAYMAKPVRLGQLRDAIGRLLEERLLEERPVEERPVEERPVEERR